MAEKAARILSKVERANEHILDFERSFTAFRDANPYFVDTKRDPHTRELIYYVRNTVDIPPRFALVAGDAIQNLRSALDHLACQLVRSNGQIPGKATEFPICRSAKEYKSESTRKVKGVRPDAKEAIDAIEPYKGGRGEELWVLHELNIIDKHRLLVAVGAAFTGMNIGRFLEGKVRQHFGRQAPRFPDILGILSDAKNSGKPIFPLEAGTVLFVDAPDSEPNQNMEFVTQIAFCEPGVAEGKPILEALHGMANLVQDIVSDFRSYL